MGTSLQYLHQNLYQLKHSRSMDNEIFKELYYEAKGHEKHANLNNLTSRSKNDRLYQETNFYLILTKMLNELKEIDPNTVEFKKNLEKVYKWYSTNKEQFAKNEKNKPNTSIRETNLGTFRSTFTLNDDRSEKSFSRATSKSTRELSPVYFPTLKNVYKLETLSATSLNLKVNSLITNDTKNTAKTSDENKPQDRSQMNKSQMSMRSEKPEKQGVESKQGLLKKTIDEKSRTEILKALSVYADQIYASIDKTDSKKLETNLKSLSKFYNALNDYNTLNIQDQTKETKTAVTLSSLVEVAKEVSDRMIISKNQLNVRISENRQLWESLKNSKKDLELKTERTEISTRENTVQKEASDIPVNNAPIYSIITRDPTKRPKSTAFTDWRGCISRPSTAKKSKSALLKFNSASNQSRPNSSVSIAQLEINEKKEGKPESEKNDEELAEKLKRQRSFSKLKHPTRESNSSCSEGREVKYVTFIAKIKDDKDQNELTSNQVTTLETLIDQSTTNLTISHPVNDKDSKNLTDNLTENGTMKTSETEKDLRCLHNEIIECECCKMPRTPSPSFVHPKHDIFHLTYVNDEHKNQNDVVRKNVNSLATETSTNPDQSTNVGLREILLTNYDPQFAAKIGVPDFLPLQVMTAQLSGQQKDLEFIPFENIDSNYPKVNGQPVYDPNINKPQRKLYRTNPSIPRPESKYGSRASVYEQILELKRQNLDYNALVVWQPEDVNLVKDLLDLEQAPLRETLKVEALKPDVKSENYALVEINKSYDLKKSINTQITPMGRPVNVNNQTRWKNRDEIIEENNSESSAKNEQIDYAQQSNSNFSVQREVSDIVPKLKLPHFKLTGSALYRNIEEHLYEGRPLPTARTINDPDKEFEAYLKYNEVKQAVHIPSIFRGTTVGRNYVKEFDPADMVRREDERKAAITIQRQYRKHLQQKYLIENRSDANALAWAINYRNELQKRKQEKENKMLADKKRIEKENAKFKALLKKIGIHVELYQILNTKGAEYAQKVLNRAANCIQKWVKGWLVRKEIRKLKEVLKKDGLDWKTFTTQYKKTILRILKMRGSFGLECEFIASEALDFYLREKKFTSYFNKLAFSNEIDLNDIGKMFNFIDLHPNNEEIQEAKLNVLKYYKKKAASSSIPKRAMFDIIYYIYPPSATKLKSTRKSTWLNPIVDGEDALRLKGFKLIEPTVIEKSWKLVREQSMNERLNSVIPIAFNKNTPVPDFEEQQNK